MTEPTQEQPAVTPTVSTAPARSRWHVSRLPAHLGRARTSTVVLAVLFLTIGTLYLNIRPETTGTATTGTVDQAPASTSAPAPAPATTTTPETTVEQPTPTEESTVSGTPTDTTTPEGTTGSTLPTTTTTAPSLSTATVSPPVG